MVTRYPMLWIAFLYIFLIMCSLSLLLHMYKNTDATNLHSSYWISLFLRADQFFPELPAEHTTLRRPGRYTDFTFPAVMFGKASAEFYENEIRIIDENKESF